MFEVDLLTAGAVGVIILSIYHYVAKQYEYFLTKPVPCVKPTFGFGSTAPTLFRTMDISSLVKKLYNAYPDSKISGFYDLLRPIYILRDPEVIKKIAVKDFDYFTDHQVAINFPEDEDAGSSLFGNSLFSLRGQKWRDMRATLSPAFTGSKMRHMFELVAECGRSMVEFFASEAKAGKTLEFEMKDVCSRFSNDVIATVAFGISVNSLRDRENEFYVNGKQILNFQSIMVLIKFLLFRAFPRLMQKLEVDFSDRKMTEYFKNMIIDNMKQREAHAIARNDMIQMLMEVRKGFDTVSSCMTFLAYELTVNTDIQKRLYEEVLETDQSLGGKPLNYDALQKMQYMDMVVSESLRKWPPFVVSDRLCVKNYRYDDGSGAQFTVEKGQTMWFPTIALHRDPRYYPNPDQFDPERFSEENRSSINTGAYIPFGVGPRNCIGSRLALMEVKSMVYYLLKEFSFEPTEKTQIPLRLSKSGFAMLSEKGVWLELKPRK
ncbi:probable cytochrome P450 9f2 isoform X2 [Toxorhynchites rutilus septentrionalis]|uniref:probable cytochrome P450 9f2 isoform X2 n=1 Tax=Toxorhynchites rutilus septentrionalis TaxID=329112 RepID=UPI00247849B1|nr:probable cytochrome P450 9f2 isoform X2 [Toxorhynchites rutilus septentrionalis]